MKKVLLLVMFAVPCFGQNPWTGIISNSRALDWTKAGLPATLPDSETTPNPWTPPTRTQCGSTITAGASPATINAALLACGTGTYVLLGPGTFTVASTDISLYAQNGVTLRGSGPMSTTMNLTGTSRIIFSFLAYGVGQCTTWASGFSQGSTSLTVTGCSGSTPSVGQVLELTQCDSGFSGATCSTGTGFDNGALFVCGYNAICQRATSGTGTPQVQQQNVLMTGVTNTGSGAYTITFSPALYMPNWGVTINSQYSTPSVSWQTGAHTVTPYGAGLEDLTVYEQSDTPTSGHTVELTGCYACWVKGVRFLANDTTQFPFPVFINNSKNALVANNYFYGSLGFGSGIYGPTIQESHDSDSLVINNISDNNVGWEGEGNQQGDVFLYNRIRNAFTFDTNDFFEHGPGGILMLYEGNQVASTEDDDTHGTHDLNTWFRNYVSGWYDPYTGAPHPSGITWNAYARFENSVGNSIGNATTTNPINVYQVFSAVYNYAYSLNIGGHTDPLVQTTAMRWGNYDSASGLIRWCGTGAESGCGGTSEIPTTLSGNAVPFQNSVPASHTLPASFFIPVTAHPAGGTGLSWWKVCTAWTTFPTSCSTSQTQPFPPVGPDVSGGAYNAGTAYDIPAQVAQTHLPIDTSLQNSYSITGSSWASGVETLTVSGLPAITHVMGGMQISGGACATAGAGTPTGAEVQITNTTSTTIAYNLAANPGACTGTMKFPDVRQFDERVFQLDSPGITPAATPTFSPSGGTPTAGTAVTISCTTPSSTIYYTVDGSTPTTSSPVYVNPLYLGSTNLQTLRAVCNAPSFSLSAVGIAAFTVTPANMATYISANAASDVPSPYPAVNRSIAAEWKDVLTTPASDCNTYNWAPLTSWLTASSGHGAVNWYTFSHIPQCANGTTNTGNPPTDIGSGDTFFKNFVTAFMQHICGVGSPSGLPYTSCSNMKYIELWNERNVGNYWTGTAAQAAVMSSDAIPIIRAYCSTCIIVMDSASAGGGGTGGQYDSWLLSEMTAMTQFPDMASFHPYPSRTNVLNVPFPTTLVSNNSATCTALNTPNVSCHMPVYQEVTNFQTAVLNQSAIKAWAQNLPVVLSEGGYGINDGMCDSGSADCNEAHANPAFLRAAYASQWMLTLAAQHPLLTMWYVDKDQCWGTVTWNGGAPGASCPNTPAATITPPSQTQTAINQTNTWLSGAAVTGTVSCTSSICTLNGTQSGSPVQWAWYQGFLASGTCSTSFANQQNLAGTTTPVTGGTVTVTNQPILLSGSPNSASGVYSGTLGLSGAVKAQ